MSDPTSLDCGIAPEDFRNAMRNQVSTVSIVACGAVGSRTGLTATAACSLSDTPAMVSICVNRSSSAHQAILDAGCFSLNFLSAGQILLADTFSGRTGLTGETRLGEGTWNNLTTGAPILDGALASFDCVLESRYEFPSHSIFAGVVKATRVQPEGGALLYAHGRYFTLDCTSDPKAA
jgi:flavin reductase (DIM6/NTAB) family NADH-FMN oxidoreductase RutF